MNFRFKATFDNLTEFRAFTASMGGAPNSGDPPAVNLQPILDRINQMANTQIADLIANMQGGFENLNAQQARSAAALDRLLASLAEMPARIQEAVDAAVANGVDESQIAALTALTSQVQAEADEARAEADRLEAAAPAPTPTPEPVPTPEPTPVPPVDTTTPTEPAPPVDVPVDATVPPTDTTTPVDPGADTTGGGAEAPDRRF